jgi:hypothetical protein
VPGTAQATQTESLCLYGKRAGQWGVVREAQNSALRGRTWWSLDQCLQELARRQVVPTVLRLLPRGAGAAGLPEACRWRRRRTRHSPVGGVDSKDEDWELKDDDEEEEGGGGGSKTV